MASVSATCLRFQPLLSLSNRNSLQATRSKLGLIGWARNTGCPSVKAFRVSCAAKPETLQKVSDIVRKQLALPAETELTPESKFSALCADSLDTVEIVMELEEEFGISVEEENSQNITTIQEAADVIEQLVEKKGAQAAN